MFPSVVKLVGIDCAVDVKKTGVAIGRSSARSLVLEATCIPNTDAELVILLADHLRASDAIVAFDAPLGWPIELGRSLSAHRAGGVLTVDAHTLFRRRTDTRIKARLGKQPLDVGADRIARTAHAALRLLQDLRDACNIELPLGWSPGAHSGSAAIEVYPAATLVSRRWPSQGYKRLDGTAQRASIVAQLRTAMSMTAALADQLVTSDHRLDAALCVLAAADYARGDVDAPDDLDVAQREGWIWARSAIAER